MHSVPVFFATRLLFEKLFTVAALMFFDFVVLSVFVLLQSTDLFTFKITFDPVFIDAVAYIVVNFEMYEVHVIL